MARAPFNTLVLPYRLRGGRYEFAVLHRSRPTMWQFIAGGGEDAETPLMAAQREAKEEGGIMETGRWIHLDSRASIPRDAFPRATWPDSVLVVPEYCFAVDVDVAVLRLSPEHDQYDWLEYEEARERLTWDSNRVALWELRERLARLSNPALQSTPQSRRG